MGSRHIELKDIENCLNFINSINSKYPGKSTYVHCKAGRTRSAIIVACYLINEKKKSPNEAIEFLEKLRHVKFYPYSIEIMNKFYKLKQSAEKLKRIY
ncbi:hypothetical protein A3Q56_07234 [Intoshia linei]|uniref:Tyrosine specific protein phosphatases domain-containing protein n=1 Tax=Intoshia linei TaxID=1819745 RepID=A0A177AUH4_9BILA|nr:hypothetical protein A3Q56_07234 [Intoshia linei]